MAFGAEHFSGETSTDEERSQGRKRNACMERLPRHVSICALLCEPRQVSADVLRFDAPARNTTVPPDIPPVSRALLLGVASPVATSQTEATSLLTLSNANISRRSIRGFDAQEWLIRGLGMTDAHGDNVMKLTPVIASSAADQLGCGAFWRSVSPPQVQFGRSDSSGRHNRQFVRSGAVARFRQTWI
jgi:hypothetical protein